MRNTYRRLAAFLGAPVPTSPTVYDGGDTKYVIDNDFGDMTVAALVKFCEDNGIDPEAAEVSGVYGEPTELRWPKETDA